MLTYKDVDNIKRAYNIESRDGKRHENDALSVDLWVQECQAMPTEENSVIFYKRQGESSNILAKNDFCLIVMTKFQQMMFSKFGSNVICIDGTHGLNRYDFELTTIMVIDEYGQGFPAAFMFSNKKDINIYEIFFKSIHQKMGNITAKTFMSDITETFYTAWIHVMGPVTYRLFCSWHVDKAWQTNLPKIGNKEKRAEVYKTLKVLQEELNEDVFQIKLVSAVNLMLKDKDTYNFGQYFKTNYVNNFKQWAYCYRKYTGINTNMRLESMHKIVKYFYLNRKTIKRLDKGLHTVLKYVRDQSIGRVIKIVKGKNTVCHKQIFKRHKLAVASKFIVHMIDESSWEIKCNSNNYLVNKLLNSKCCNLVCPICKVCIHMYSCTCDDFTHNLKFCKHIHYVKLHQHSRNEEPTDVPECLPEDSEHFITLLGTSQTEHKNTDLINKVNQTFVKLQNCEFTELDDTIISEMNMHLNILNNLVDLPNSSHHIMFKNNHNITCDKTSNKNIVPQLRFSSTQKKRKRQNIGNKKPNKREKIIISNILNGNLEEYVSQNSSYDHTYCKFN